MPGAGLGFPFDSFFFQGESIFVRLDHEVSKGNFRFVAAMNLQPDLPVLRNR